MKAPTWTVVYGIVSPESPRFVGTGWEFFDDQLLAQHCYQRHVNVGNCPTMRPYHDGCDRQHLGVVHWMMDTPKDPA